MSGWSESEERFDVQPSDFTATRPESSVHGATGYEMEFASTGSPPESNYFYQRLGFKVGLFFEGERKVYRPKK